MSHLVSSVLKNRVVRCLTAGALAGVLATTAAAEDVSLRAQAERIEALLEAGDATAARQAARDFLHDVTRRGGFGVSNTRLTISPASGFGVYEPRESQSYLPDEPVFAYVEVFGYSLTPDAAPNAPGLATRAEVVGAFQMAGQEPSLNRMLFDVAFTLLDSEGTQVTPELVPMGEVELATLAEPVDGYFSLTYRINGVEGDYTILTEVTDRASGAVATFQLPVTFVGRPVSDEPEK